MKARLGNYMAFMAFGIIVGLTIGMYFLNENTKADRRKHPPTSKSYLLYDNGDTVTIMIYHY